MELKPGYKQTEVGIIPEEWEAIPVADAGEVLGGRQRSPQNVGHLCSYLRVANVFAGYISTDDVLQMPFTTAERERFLLKDGDILLNEGQSIDLVGRSAIYRGEPPACCFQNTLVRFRAASKTDPEFVQSVFQQYLRTGVFAGIALQTTSIAHLGSSRLAKLKVPFPPLLEQAGIATALSDVDALLNGLDQLIVKKRDIKQAAMQQLLTGKQRLPGFGGDSKPVYKQTEAGMIPEDWKVSTVGTEFEIQLGKMLDADKNVGLSKPYVGNRAVQWNNIDVTDLPRMAMSRSELERFRLRRGDLLICEGGEVGRAALWEDPIEECYYQKALHRLRPIKGFNPRLMLALMQHLINQDLLANYVTQTSIAHLTKEKLAEIPIAVPTTSEQGAIVSVLTDMDIELVALEQRRDKTRALKQGMMQELLTGRIRLV